MKKLLLLLICAGCIGLIITSLRKDPRREVLNTLEEVVKYAVFDSEKSGQHPIETLSLAKSVSKYFSDPCVFTFLLSSEEKTFTVSRQEIIQRYGALRQALAQLATSIKDASVQMGDDRATVTAQVTAMGREPGRDDYFLEKHEVEIIFKFVEGKWLISQARNLDPIEEAD